MHRRRCLMRRSSLNVAHISKYFARGLRALMYVPFYTVYFSRLMYVPIAGDTHPEISALLVPIVVVHGSVNSARGHSLCSQLVVPRVIGPQIHHGAPK